jgi:PAS domain S-box-containing protein
LQTFSPDVILSDHTLPSFDSVEALKILRKSGIEIPFILITSTNSEKFAVEMLLNGADDYILKTNLTRLPYSVRQSIERHRVQMADKKAKEELQSSHEKLLFYIENSPLGFIEWDNTLHVKSWSKRTEEIFGWSEKEFIENNKTGFSQIYFEDLPWVTKIAHKLISGKVMNNNIQHRNIRRDGSVIWCEWFNTVLKDKDGKVITIMSLVQDITERKKNEENLKNNEQRFREFFEWAPEAIVVFDSDSGNFIDCNENSLSLIKCSRKELMNKSIGDISPPSQPDGKNSFEKAREMIMLTLEGEKPIFEWTIIDSEGKHIFCEIRLVKLTITGRNLVRTTIIDITARKLAEETLRRSEANLRAIFNNTIFSYILINPELKVLSFNPIAAQWAKNSLNFELKAGEKFLSCFPKAQHEEILKRIEMVLKGATIKYETNYLQLNNSINYYEISFSPVLSGKGKVLEICIAFNDITERKESEIETLMLVNRLESKNKNLGQFAYMVSHNLRAPIAKIQGLASLFESEKGDHVSNKALLGYIANEAVNLDEVVKDMNAIITARDSENEIKEYVDFETKIKLIKQVLENEINEGIVQIITDFHEHPGITTVKSYLYSILFNLLSNALKYRSPEVPLLIHLRSTLDNGFICISVKDNGIGIDLHKYGEKLFGLYKRFHNKNIPGKGIGLNLVKTQVETLGGRIEVESEVNRGTEFKIFLPV